MIKKLMLWACVFWLTGQVMAQSGTVSGKVTDATDGSTLPGVTVLIKGSTTGAISDFDGNYSINVQSGATLVFSFVGYTPQEIVVQPNTTVNVALQVEATQLEELVVIGYGVQKKNDATGSVTAIGADDFNKGAITSPQELLVGKSAGVQIVSNGGAPGAGATIRIRGGSSLSASNDPLIVIDGVPVDNGGVAGMRNPLSAVNPNDIETFTVLKDASATAIYGSRASNGVIIITTKKGKKGSKLKLSYAGNVTYNTIPKFVDVLDATEFKEIINTWHDASNLGEANTNWQKEIFQNAVAHDHNISATGSVKNFPYRASIGYTDQEGILKTSAMNRTTFSVGIDPTLFQEHLKVSINAKGMNINNDFANEGAIGAAVGFDPTQAVTSTDPKYDRYGGYFTWLLANGDPIDIAPTNPVAMLMLTKNESNVKKLIGNVQLDYKMHFLPDLRANLNIGYDGSVSDGYSSTDSLASWAYKNKGGYGEYGQRKKNELLDFYLNYVKDINDNNRIDVMAGYSWQHFWLSEENWNRQYLSGEKKFTNDSSDFATESYLVSFFGRLNYSLANRYLFTATIRQDGSSRFSSDTRWGLFPAFAFAWKIKEESFLKDVNLVSELKLRLGYGATGQQNLGLGDYPYMPRYIMSNDGGRYQLGDSAYYTLRPNPYDLFLKWEATETYNAGIDYGFSGDRINGSIDVYYRKTENLLNTLTVPAGANLSNVVLTNVGNLENKGVEFAINAYALKTVNMEWRLGFNATYNQNKITKLTANVSPTYPGDETGGELWIGKRVLIHQTGYPANTFYVYKQKYEDGKPVAGFETDKRYYGKHVAPDVFMGISTNFSYKNFDFASAGRISIGNYVYNNASATRSAYKTLQHASGYYVNAVEDIKKEGFADIQHQSDFYVQDASFFRLDNVNLGYNFNDLANGKIDLRLSASVQNVFVVTKYKGLDPEVDGGVDNNIYPRPRTFLLGVNLDF